MTHPLVTRTLMWLIALALLAFACEMLLPMRVSAQPRPSASAGHFIFAGADRTYALYRPPSLARATAVRPRVRAAGGYGTGKGAEYGLHWDRAADAHGFVALYPDGVSRAWNAGARCGAGIFQKQRRPRVRKILRQLDN